MLCYIQLNTFFFYRKLRESLQQPIDFFRLFLTNNLVMMLCIATNENATMLIRKGEFKSYATDGEWVRVNVEEMYM